METRSVRIRICECRMWRWVPKSSVSVTRGYSYLVASATMWEIETDSVGNGPEQSAVDPGQPSCVGSPPAKQPTNQRRRRRRRRPNQTNEVLSCDFFTVDTVLLKRLYALFFIELSEGSESPI